MSEEREVHEAKEVKDVQEKNAGVAAFFDLDGTLIPLPSVEMRFFSLLRYRGLLGIRSYFAWLSETARLIPRGINRIMYGNKMYLRNVSVDEKSSLRVPSFCVQAIERTAWHAERGHLIVIVSGTLEPLAELAARAMEAELETRGVRIAIRVCATRLQEKDKKWTGRIAGEAMFGEAKARAVRRIAATEHLNLAHSFAYGDSAHDKWMLEAVGRPAAVNPSNDLARIARRNDWLVLHWEKGKKIIQRTQSALRAQKTDESEHELQVAPAKAGFRI